MCAMWVCIAHDVGNGFLNSKIKAHGDVWGE